MKPVPFAVAQLAAIRETSVCNYTLTVCTPLLCDATAAAAADPNAAARAGAGAGTGTEVAPGGVAPLTGAAGAWGLFFSCIPTCMHHRPYSNTHHPIHHPPQNQTHSQVPRAAAAGAAGALLPHAPRGVLVLRILLQARHPPVPQCGGAGPQGCVWGFGILGWESGEWGGSSVHGPYVDTSISFEPYPKPFPPPQGG